MIIACDGSDGSVKKTAVVLLHQKLTEIGVENIVVDQPGTTSFGRAIYNMVNNCDFHIVPFAERLLFAADYVNTHERIIKPALEERKVVIMNRFSPVTDYVYGSAAGVSLFEIASVRSLLPVLTADALLVFRTPLDSIQSRLKARREHSRIEDNDALIARVVETYNNIPAWTDTGEKVDEMAATVYDAVKMNVRKIIPIDAMPPHEAVNKVFNQVVEIIARNGKANT